MKNYIIVGGTKGIGLEIANQLKAQHQVFVLARNQNDLVESEHVHFIAADITDATFDATMLPEVIDGVVYCPGSINLKPFHRLTQADFASDWQINVLGAIKVLQAVLPNLKRAENPSIVLFSTVAVSIGMSFHASIAAAKGAIEGLTRSLAAEFAPKIRVNCIAPSLTDTSLAGKLLSSDEKREISNKRHPLQRIGQPEDIASMACFLLSNQTSWMTGQVLHIDGGMSTLKV